MNECRKTKDKSRYIYKYYTLVGNAIFFFFMRVWVNNSETAVNAYQGWTNMKMGGSWWEPDFSLLGQEVTDKQGRKARINQNEPCDAGLESDIPVWTQT